MKKIAVIILAVITLFFSNSAMATFEKKYLEDFAKTNDSVVFETADGNWIFTLPNENCSYPSTVNGVEGRILLMFSVTGYTDTYAIPSLIIEGEQNFDFQPEKLEISIGDDLYTITELDPNFFMNEKGENNKYSFIGLIFPDPDGIQLLNSLKASNYVFAARVYGKAGQMIDFAQLPNEKMTASYDHFYQALVGSDYLDRSGNPSKATIMAILDKIYIQSSKVEIAKGKLSPTEAPRSEYLTVLGQETIAKYELIKMGNSGDNVIRLKTRLYDLGYAKNKSGNNKYTADTAKAIKAFQAVHALEQTGDATPDTQALLFSEYALPKPTPTPKPTKTPKPSPTPYIEPEVPVDISNCRGKLIKGSPVFSFIAKNISNSKIVDGFTVVYFGLDVYGVKIPIEGSALYGYETVNVILMPGKKERVANIAANGLDKANRIYAAIYKIHCTDGTTIEIDERDWYFKSIGK